MRCPSCNGPLGPVFYETGSVPVHSCLLLETSKDALGFPRGTVRLASCADCGLISNLDFDPKTSVYAPEYEDQQAFSPTFNAFARDLAEDLVRRHDLRGASVVEIGCSKGDFLALLCEEGVARGIGVDPSALAGRVPAPVKGTLEFREDYYDDTHLSLPAKLILNRHTLEHVQDVYGMLSRMHRHAVAAGDAKIFIEVPSMSRVLQDCAFEDIYFEHCVYFTPGTLARALRKAGFGVTRLWLDYDDQYLLAEAVTDPQDGMVFEIEETPQDVHLMITEFEAHFEGTLETWRRKLRDLEASGQTFAIWGSGSKCIAFWHAMGQPTNLTSIVDINPNRWGKYPPGMGLPISDPATLSSSPPDVVVIMNAIYRREIQHELTQMDLSPTILTLGRDGVDGGEPSGAQRTEPVHAYGD